MQTADVDKERGTWPLVGLAYFFFILAFVFVRLVLVSQARDPYLFGMELPRAEGFRIACGLTALLFGISGLTALGFVADRGSGRQLLVAIVALPFVLVLLEAVTLDL
ncbi:MAG: hypothetical protein J0M12_01100 [Deltaproteobacteria bacterium]|nr:hypothetical protein [Deltaproteobacteria bacterium]